MKRYCTYSGGYHDNDPVIIRFWNMLSKLSVEEQQQFLMFVTSCSRAPLLGFKGVHPPFCIHRTVSIEGDDAVGNEGTDVFLPTASTCMNFLKMPPYTNEDIMRLKFLYAIGSKSGFELS